MNMVPFPKDKRYQDDKLEEVYRFKDVQGNLCIPEQVKQSLKPLDDKTRIQSQILNVFEELRQNQMKNKEIKSPMTCTASVPAKKS